MGRVLNQTVRPGQLWFKNLLILSTNGGEDQVDVHVLHTQRVGGDENGRAG